MYSRGFDSFFAFNDSGAAASPSYDFSFMTGRSFAAQPKTTWDGPASGSVGGSLDGTPEVEQFFAVNLTAGVTYTFAERPTATGGIEDPFLYLLNSGGGLITYDDDGGAGRSSLLSYTPTVTGTYYLAAGSWVNDFNGGGDVGSFTLYQWDSTQPDAGGTLATAMSITTGVTFGNKASNSDVDVYKITLTAGDYYTFAYSGGFDGAGETGTVGRLQLLDAAGNILVTPTVTAETGMGYFAQTTGTYYVKVSPFTGAGTATGGYTLDVTGVDPATKDPLDAIRWKSANNIPTHDIDGVPTATIYFGAAGETFGQTGDDGNPMVTLGWTQTQINSVMNALNTSYTPITGIHYVQTTDASTATFRLATDHSTQYGAYFDPQDPAFGASQGVGVFNVDSGGFTIDASLQQGGFSYAVVLHEFGHAHGLAHPHDTGGGSDVMLGVTASQGSYGIYDLNQQVYTVMSYNYAWPLDPDGTQPFTRATVGSGWNGSLSAFDIAALQDRYGVHANATGNDTYTISDNQATAYYQTIWDTGGNDSIVYTGAKDAVIDLTAATLDYSPTGGGVLSFAHGVFGGYTIANGVVIENATGGSGNDVLLGNSANNVLTGNAGNDTLMGRDGNDTLIGGAGNDTLNGGAGVDTASYAGATSGVNVNLVAGTATGGAGSDTLSLIENVIGSAYQDRIIGDANVNKVATGNGIDVVTLGGGNDTFVAEQGTKVATKTGTWSWDIITDFDQAGDDVIDVSGLGTFHWIGSAANKSAFDLSYKMYDSVNGAEKALGIDIDGQPGATQTGPVTIVYGNTDGGSPDFAIVLLNTSFVDASDFILGPTSASAQAAVQLHSDYMFL